MKKDLDMQRVIREYDAANEDTKKVLEGIFGKETFQRKITDRVKTYQDACEVLGIEPVLDGPVSMSWPGIAGQQEEATVELPRNVKAMLKLEVICEALNEGWKPCFDGNTWHYWPWFWLYTPEEVARMTEDEKKERNLRPIKSGVCFGGHAYHGAHCGFASARSYNAPTNAYAGIGSRLCLKSEELAVYCGKQFIDLWMEFRLA